MKTVTELLLAACALLFAAGATAAEGEGDRILGLYRAVEEGSESRIEFTRLPDGAYRGQIIWLKEPDNPDGTPKLDVKNPDRELRKLRADRIVVIDRVSYDPDAKRWSGGRVYNPKNGKSYKVTLTFEDDRTLRVKGSLLGFSRSVYWEKTE